MIARLKAEIRARDDFVAIAAHELRNPMTSILGLVELLESSARRDPESCSPKVRDRLALLHGEITGFIKRATLLLDTTRIISGMLQLKPEWIDLSAIIESAIQRHEIRAVKMGSSINADVERGLHGYWDALAIEQIMDNLLSNAVKYGGPSEISVKLADLGNAARFTIKDHGRGMTPAELDRIFSRFEQAVARRDSYGFGIGLWLVRGLIDAMRGSIDVRSEPGNGTSFEIVLPKDAGPTNRNPNEQPSAS
ncbi:MAG TPA: HAMP domain-containing sensor histidine kinase [Rhodanobacteraceae bacterium]|nr:HAMP domain-containing sensor histidine kinase [Rhodanobacteraceae bacterium]